VAWQVEEQLPFAFHCAASANHDASCTFSGRNAVVLKHHHMSTVVYPRFHSDDRCAVQWCAVAGPQLLTRSGWLDLDHDNAALHSISIAAKRTTVDLIRIPRIHKPCRPHISTVVCIAWRRNSSWECSLVWSWHLQACLRSIVLHCGGDRVPLCIYVCPMHLRMSMARFPRSLSHQPLTFIIIIIS